MSGPDTFLQAAAAFLDFDADDSDENETRETTKRPATQSAEHGACARMWHGSWIPTGSSFSAQAKSDVKKKRIRSKIEVPETQIGIKKRNAAGSVTRCDRHQMAAAHPGGGPSNGQSGMEGHGFKQSVDAEVIVQPSVATKRRPQSLKKKSAIRKQRKHRTRPKHGVWTSSEEEIDDRMSGGGGGGPSSDSDEDHLAEEDCLYGCQECHYCWKGCLKCRREGPMVSRPKLAWRPSRLHDQQGIPSGPIYHPTEEEFKDPFGYISQIRPEAEQYGICMIVPPASWKKPKDPLSTDVDDYEFYPKRQLVSSLCIRSGFGQSKNDTSKGKGKGDADSASSEDEFGYTTSEMSFSFRSFKAFADWSHHMHFAKNSKKKEKEEIQPSTEEIEGEFWRLVEHEDETEFETFYGSDLDASQFPNAFIQPPRSCSYKSDWNVSTWPLSTDSLLRYLPGEQLITGVMIPWVYFGSSLSAFCWHVEDHALYSINYLHSGASKVWYGVPSARSSDFETAMMDAFPKLFESDPRLLHRLVTHLSPKELRSRGIPVYRIEHKPGCFVVTFPNGYHGGFNCGWNCAEAVNFAPPDWLPHGSDVIAKYRRQQRPTTFSHDSLLIAVALSIQQPMDRQAASLAVKYAMGELHLRAQEETKRRKVAHETGISKEMRMHGGRDATDGQGVWTDTEDKDCEVCKCDLFLSAVVSPQHPGQAVCPEHASQLSSNRTMLYRYTLEELNKMIEDAKCVYPDCQDFIDRALQRTQTPRTAAIVKQGPFCGKA